MSCLVVGENILVTGKNLSQILNYNPEQDRFLVILDSLPSNREK